MKYLRTNTEIYATDDLYVCEELNGKPYATKDGGWCIYRESIVEEANTIEELCDAFVCVFADGDHYVSYNSSEAIDRKKGLVGVRKVKNCYAAIWTDIGLIYVAKLTEKDEWELI